MDKVRQLVVLTVLGAIVLSAAGWFLLVSPKRSEATDLRAQVAQQETSNQALRTQIQVLKAQAKALPAKQAQLAAVAAKIPETPDLPALIYSLQKAAAASDVELVSMTPSAPVDVAAAPAVVAPAGGTAATPAGALKQIDLSLNVVGGYFQVEQFLDQVESLSRAMKVKGITMAPGDNPVEPDLAGALPQASDKVLSAAISARVFMAPGRSSLAPVTAPAVGK